MPGKAEAVVLSILFFICGIFGTIILSAKLPENLQWYFVGVFIIAGVIISCVPALFCFVQFQIGCIERRINEIGK